MQVYLYRKTIIDTKQDVEIPNRDTYLCKFMFDSFGNYDIALFIFAIINILGAILVLFAKKPTLNSV